MHYILVMRDDRFWLIGPFETKEALCKYADKNWSLEQDPRWQSIELADAAQPVEIIAPLHARMSLNRSMTA